MTSIIVVSWICTAIFLFDAMRRTQAQWVHADRDRGWWTVIGTVLGLMALGPVVLLVYVLTIVPRFSRPQTPQSGEGRIRNFGE